MNFYRYKFELTFIHLCITRTRTRTHTRNIIIFISFFRSPHFHFHLGCFIVARKKNIENDIHTYIYILREYRTRYSFVNKVMPRARGKNQHYSFSVLQSKKKKKKWKTSEKKSASRAPGCAYRSRCRRPTVEVIVYYCVSIARISEIIFHQMKYELKELNVWPAPLNRNYDSCDFGTSRLYTQIN